MTSKSTVTKLTKTVNSKTVENKVLEAKNKSLKQELGAVKNKLERKIHQLTGEVDKEVIRAKETIGSVLGDIKENVKNIKTKSAKLIAGGGKARKTHKKNKSSKRKTKSVSWWF